jgi:hypothetical protein
MKKVTILTQLTLQDFVSANYALLLQKKSTKLLLLVAMLMILLPAILAITGTAPYNWIQSLIGIGLIGFYILSSYLTARKNYQSIPGISEPLTYEFSNDKLVCIGPASSSESDWTKVHRVSETKNCLLIWRSSQVVNVLPKRNITADQLNAIKEMVRLNKVKNNLK